MISLEKRIIYPEGDIQEIDHKLKINQVVGLNGIPLNLPLETSKIIAYRVFKVSTKTNRNEEITNYHLELIDKFELESLSIK